MLIVFLVTGAGIIVHAQDRSTNNPPLLPFQQNAPTTGNEEQLAMQFFQSRDFEKAAELLEKIYDKKPGSYYYTYYLYSLIEIKDYDRAEKLIRAQRKLEPNALRYQVDLGYVEYRAGESDKARKQYDDAIKKLPADQQQVFDLANAFVARGENDYAIRVDRKSVV